MFTPKYVEPKLTSISILDGDDLCEHEVTHLVGMYRFKTSHPTYKWRVIEIDICEYCEGIIKKTWLTAYADYEEGGEALLLAMRPGERNE